MPRLVAPRLSLQHLAAAATLALSSTAPTWAQGTVTSPANKAPASAQPASAAPAKTPITRADQLPRRTVTLQRLPSEMLNAPLAELQSLGEGLRRDILADLANFDIQDAATMRGLHSALMTLAMLRGDLADTQAQAAAMRALHEKRGLQLTAGLANQTVAEVRAAGGGAEEQAQRLRSVLTQRLNALPWADVEIELKGTKSAFETMNPALTEQALRDQADVMARNANMTVPVGLALGVIGARVTRDQVVPLREALLASYTSVVDARSAAAPARPDRWTARTMALSADARATPVLVGVWDSGVDLSLFRSATAPAARGIAFNDMGQQVPDLLRPLGDAQARWPRIRSYVKGAFDLQTALDTEDSRRLKAAIASLKPEELKGFQEDLAIGTLYTHGTHVAGIAVDGNPFASVFAVSTHYSHKTEPLLPTEARARQVALSYQQAVDALKTAGVRVVNMSWRYGPAAYEGALTYHNVGANVEERKRLAQQMFTIERDALRAAMASAPNILFVAGSGNENNSADFSEYIPAGLELPNLITVGAVDKSGEETAFSTFGRTVVVHANGFEVDSLLPGGDRARFSGTSMAAPQVTNLAAKMLALNPALTPLQLKERILANAERRGRVNLIYPKATISALMAQRGS
jgi:hypothetical protein